jgi:S1-C subfamily serine protease
MKSTRLSLVILVFCVFSVFPVATRAAWWDVFSLKPFTKATTTTTAPAGISGSRVNNPPTIQELQGRIADLEAQLRDAQVQIITLKEAVMTPKATVAVSKTTTTAPAPVVTTSSSGLSSASIQAKIKSALVSIQTATSTGVGTIIDSQGRILTDAHTVWSQDTNGRVLGAADVITVTLSNGDKKQATLVGIDEALDVALIQLTSKGTSSYIKLDYDSGIGKDSTVYIASIPFSNGVTTGGTGFVPATVSKVTSFSIETVADGKPLDTGGALLNSNGNLIGIPNKSTCKVIEDTKNCLKYTITSNLIRTSVSKLMQGMRLYKQMLAETPEEALVRGELDGIYNSVNESGVITYAISNASGDNSFDYFNTRLGNDTDGKIAHLYALKLKQIADGMYQASDFLKSKAQDLDIFLTNESGNIVKMGDYQRMILDQLKVSNVAKLKEYQAKLDLWTKKKNEYDALLAKTTPLNHDYLMAEGAFEESSTAYFSTEKNRILKAFSGEPVNIF